MKETGLIVVYANGLDQGVFQLSLQDNCLAEKVIKPPCEHDVCLLNVEVSGWEYLALSCSQCRNISLMNISKLVAGMVLPFRSIPYGFTTAFNGEGVSSMCQGEQGRLFVKIGKNKVLELDTSATTFTRVNTIQTGNLT